MSLSRIDGPFGAILGYEEGKTSGFSASGNLIDAAGEKMAFLGHVYAPSLLNGGKKYIKAVGFMWVTVTKGATTAVKLTLQGWSATAAPGQPDGVEGSVVAIPNAQLTTGWKTSDVFDVNREVGLFDPLAIVWEFSTFETGDLLRLNTCPNTVGLCTSALYTAGAWGNVVQRPNLLLIFSDDTYGILLGASANTAIGSPTEYNSGSTPNDRGIRFRVPAEVECMGARLYLRQYVAGSDFDVLLTDAAGTTLRSRSIVAKRMPNTTIPYFMSVLWSPYALSPDADFQITVKPTTANNVRIHSDTVPVAEAIPLMMMAALKGVYRTGAGSWTEQPTIAYWIWPLLSGIGRGGLSGLTGPNMFTPLVRP